MRKKRKIKNNFYVKGHFASQAATLLQFADRRNRGFAFTTKLGGGGGGGQQSPCTRSATLPLCVSVPGKVVQIG